MHLRGCTLAWNKIIEAIFGVWAAPGARETLQKGGGRSPPPFARVSGAPGAGQTPNMNDFESLTNSIFFMKMNDFQSLNVFFLVLLTNVVAM